MSDANAGGAPAPAESPLSDPSAAKSLLASRTVWALAIAAAASVLQQHTGKTVSAADQLALVNDMLGLVQYGGMALALVFRVVAKRPLK